MKKKKICLVLGAVLTAFLMVSSTTAVNISQHKAVDEQTPEIVDKKQKEEKEKTNSGCPLCAKMSDEQKTDIKEKIKEMGLNTDKAGIGEGKFLCAMICSGFILFILFPFLILVPDPGQGGMIGYSIGVFCTNACGLPAPH
ncbi:MAG: hypothetical protein V5A64_06105 [Candidatus Thermoplasmatota archaeon]